MSSSPYQTRSRTSASRTSSVTIEARGQQQNELPRHFRASPPINDTQVLRRSTRNSSQSYHPHPRAHHQQQQQQASELTQAEEPMSTSNEDDLQKDLKTQIQPIIQNYVNQTKRSLPIDLSLDMSTLIQMPQH